MWDYWFVDNESGEEFFVECATKEEAWEIATKVAAEIAIENSDEVDLELVQVITPAEAEMWGLDTY